MSLIAVPGPVGPRVAFVVVATGWAAHVAVLSRRLSAARTDPVTGLGTRTVFDRRAARFLARRPALVVFVDQDKFKQINDTYGHAVGDVVLRRTAGRLAAWAGPRGLAARVGGDEFVTLRPLDLDHPAEPALARLHRALTGPVPGAPPGDAVTGASVGAVLAPPGTTLTAALLAADTALYRAKNDPPGWALGSLDDPSRAPHRHKRAGTGDLNPF